ncbi:MAG: GNAT family N-acetyltransferase [Turicibacter sp.]
MVEQFRDEHLDSVIKLWNEAARNQEFRYDEINLEQAQAIFCGEHTHSIVLIHNGEIIGFGSAYHVHGAEVGYITFVYVNKYERHQQYGTKLLKALEARLIEEGAKRIDMLFLNPINLIWVIENTPHHVHPNAPGVEVNSEAYQFFEKHGYVDVVKQNSYYRLLDGFNYEGVTPEQLKALKASGIKMEYYNPDIHVGMNELFDDFDHSAWRDIIMGNIHSEHPHPVLIISEHNVVKGFTGPLYVQDNGRGYFSGIGIHSSIRGNGAGKWLFSGLCRSLKDEGATYMSLFTGDTNPARRIYEAAGFDIVKSWGCFRKVVSINE